MVETLTEEQELKMSRIKYYAGQILKEIPCIKFLHIQLNQSEVDLKYYISFEEEEKVS